MKNNKQMNMNTTITLLKTGLVGLFLMGVTSVRAQLISLDESGSLQPPLSGTGTEAIFVYGGSGFTLTASTTSSADGGEAGQTFTDFDWLFRTAGGGGDAVSSLTSATTVVGGTSNSELTVTGLAPGFYTFIAQGITSDAICSPEEEEFTVFVLRPLTITINLGGDANLLYCEDDLESAANTLTATASYDETVDWNAETDLSSSNPALDAFELRYRWYKVADGSTLDIETATPIATSAAGATTTDIYTFVEGNDTEVGEWNYYVAVNYTVKASGQYTTVLGGATDPTIIEVTPKPGKPTITIEAL